jgi:flagellar biosynthesis chaperone FliJ
MDQLLDLVFGAGAVFLGFILRGFTNSYVSEKGKNTATKEDLGEITSKVESIRSQLSELSSFRSARRDNQQKHLLAFHDVAVEILHERYSVNFGDLPMDEGKSLFAFQSAFQSNIVTLLREYQRLVLFLPDGHGLRQQALAVVQAAILSQGAFKSRYGAVKSTSIAEQMAYASGDKVAYRQSVEEANEANSKFWSEMQPHIRSFSDALQAFVSELSMFLSQPSNPHS